MADRGSDKAGAVAAERGLLFARLVLVLVLTGLTVWQTVNLLVAYSKCETVTTAVKAFSNSVAFPSVTICNYNRWKMSLINNAPETLAVRRAYMSHNGDQAQSDAGASATAGGSTSANLSLSASVNLYNFTLTKGWQLIDAENAAAWPNRSKTLLRCAFGDLTCTTKSFKHRVTSLGNCFTFNYDPGSDDTNSSGDGGSSTSSSDSSSFPLMQRHASENSGLSLLIDIEKDDYAETIVTGGSQMLGLKVLIHPHGEEPDPSTQGLSVSPGNHASIEVTKTEYSYLEPPYGSCNATASLLYSNKRYTSSACEQECKMFYADQNCSCRPFSLPTTGSTMCGITATLTCQVVLDTINQDFAQYCSCPQPCYAEEFTYSVSYAAFPSPRIAPEMAAKYGTSPVTYSSSVVSLTMYMKEIGTTQVTQMASMTMDTLLSDLGGILGLFLGLSCVSIVELLEKLSPVLVSLVHRLLSRRSATVASTSRLQKTQPILVRSIPAERLGWSEVLGSTEAKRPERRRSIASPIQIKHAF